MDIVDLTEDNVIDYESYLGEDRAENIGRTFYRGIVVHDDMTWELAGGMIWEIHGKENPEKSVISHIEWMHVKSPEVADALFKAYEERVRDEG